MKYEDHFQSRSKNKNIKNIIGIKSEIKYYLRQIVAKCNKHNEKTAKKYTLPKKRQQLKIYNTK